MAGSITANILQSDTTSPPTFKNNSVEIGQLCVAWVNFNGTVATPSTIRASFNVTSITKNGTGDYTVNLTNALANTNGCVVLGQSYLNSRGDAAGNHNTIAGGYIATTSTVNVQTVINSANAYYDVTTFSVAVFSS